MPAFQTVLNPDLFQLSTLKILWLFNYIFKSDFQYSLLGWHFSVSHLHYLPLETAPILI